MSEDLSNASVSFDVDDEYDNTQVGRSGGVRGVGVAGRGQSARGGSAESALGLAGGRSLAGESLRAAGIGVVGSSARDQYAGGNGYSANQAGGGGSGNHGGSLGNHGGGGAGNLSYEMERAPSRLDRDGAPSRLDDEFRERSRSRMGTLSRAGNATSNSPFTANANLAFTASNRAAQDRAASVLQGTSQYAMDYSYDDEDDRRVRGVKSANPLLSTARERGRDLAAREGELAAGHRERELAAGHRERDLAARDRERERERLGSALGREASPFGTTRRAGAGPSGLVSGGSSGLGPGSSGLSNGGGAGGGTEHTRLMTDSLTMFEACVAKLGLTAPMSGEVMRNAQVGLGFCSNSWVSFQFDSSSTWPIWLSLQPVFFPMWFSFLV